MEEMVCPHCHRVSYSASSRAFSPCPHCKFRFAISDEQDCRYLVIDRQLAHMRKSYSEDVSAEGIEVIVDRRRRQRPFVGVDQRRVTTFR
ncbi:MAG: hypothetical protein IBX61_07040 [Thermoleophilia bacterium]|nr:hypothetical protein [Thermoleophilia bacterium]